jgi:hypothetical protein
MRGMLSQIRFQAIVVALVPIAVLAAMLAYTIATRNSTAVTAFWADHTQRAIEANYALMNALTEETHTVSLYRRTNDARDEAAFVHAAQEVNRRAAALLAVADATPTEAHQAQVYVSTVDAENRFLTRLMAAQRRGDTVAIRALESAPATQQLSAQLNIAKRDVDKSERILAVTALRTASNYLTRFSTIILAMLLGGVVLFLILAVGFGGHVCARGICATTRKRYAKDVTPIRFTAATSSPLRNASTAGCSNACSKNTTMSPSCSKHCSRKRYRACPACESTPRTHRRRPTLTSAATGMTSSRSVMGGSASALATLPDMVCKRRA